jgi:hypothetical protein
VCKNSATCVESQDGIACQCRNGFWGERCENYDNPCLNMPCQNGGRCSVITTTHGLLSKDDRMWAWQCDCKYPYYGERCEKKVDLFTICSTLAENPCKNGGSCVSRNYQSAYALTPVSSGGGYFVNDASFDVLDLSPNVFRLQKEAWACKCAPGFFGDTCELTADPAKVVCPATNPCNNGGTCFVNGNAFWSCACPCGYAGHLCQISATNRIFNGAVGIGGRMRFCANGVSCQNGGTCWDNANGNGFSCYCPTSYYGTYCELKGRSAAVGVAPSLLVVAAAALIAALKF